MSFEPKQRSGAHKLRAKNKLSGQTGLDRLSFPLPDPGMLLRRSLGNAYLQRDAKAPGPTNGPLSGDGLANRGGAFVQRFPGMQGACPLCSEMEDEDDAMVQPKLMVGPADDHYEREADRVADQVLQMSEAKTQPKDPEAGHIMRPEDDQEMTADRLDTQIEARMAEDGLQAKREAGDALVTDGLESALSVSKGSGKALPDSTRAEMESAFGVDFAGVRLHTDNSAVQMSRNINAHAFTYGQNIYFNDAKFNPSSKDGKRLLAHELTHTLQQGGER